MVLPMQYCIIKVNGIWPFEYRILSALRMDDKTVRKQANELADMLEKYDKEKQ